MPNFHDKHNTSKLRGYTHYVHPRLLPLWELLFCKRGWHVWDEVVSDEHYLYCDACGETVSMILEPERLGADYQDGSNRNVPFFGNIMCEGCERMGAYDFMGDYLCLNCADVEWVTDGADDGGV